MDLRELRYFVALAEERHFGRAAERLYIAQSGLSKAIRRAENELGVALFERTHRNVALTPAGEALLERAYDVLGAFEEVRATAEAARIGMAGVLSLATSPVARYNLAPALLERFATACPEVRVVRREQLAAEILQEILAGTLDVGITFCAPPREGLRHEPLKDVPLRVLISSSHPLAARHTVALAELRSERFLIPAESPASGSASRLEPFFKAAGFEPEYVQSTIAYDEDLHEVRRGEGVVLSTRTFLGDPPSGIVALDLEPPATLTLGVVRRARQAPSAILLRFIELTREVAVEQGWRTAQG
ncbi:MAG: LysR family transcriptional regulator [Solirubrobacterales bacterium]